ncbi:MAG TPA: aconitase X catalytic domain-containing protein [Anaerovoracaceae bacterium]|nr:aconitase X catalytic domain-containing protein [Anaerovoracaceae bacterium]
MYLTDEEKSMLSGERGEMVQKCMKVLVTLGEIYGAKRMLEINSVHSPGVSYRVTGDAGLNYVKDASKESCFAVPTTLNNIGIDMHNWEAIGFDPEFVQKQMELSEAYREMGAFMSNSCTPYLYGNIPLKGEHVAWGESSAIAFVNSVLGARTNREGGPTALAAAITGRVPEYGLHLDENRKGTYLFKVEVPLKNDTDYASMGYYCGAIAGRGIPVFTGIEKRPTLENLKALSAALASSGAVALYHIIGVTPEAPTLKAVIDGEVPVYSFGKEEYQKAFETFNYSGAVDFVVFGCPHASIQEMKILALLFKDKKVKAETWVCTSHQVKDLAFETGYGQVLEEAGVTIICDTCPILCPTLDKGYNNVVTNSGKLAHYIRGLWNMKSRLANAEDCMKAAVDGRLE